MASLSLAVRVLIHWNILGLFSSAAGSFDAATEPWYELLMDHWPGVYASTGEYFLHLERADYQDALFSALAFPFQPLPIPTFDLVVRWDESEYVGALMTSSAAERCDCRGRGGAHDRDPG